VTFLPNRLTRAHAALRALLPSLSAALFEQRAIKKFGSDTGSVDGRFDLPAFVIDLL
jgi:hypothetical protein